MPNTGRNSSGNRNSNSGNRNFGGNRNFAGGRGQFSGNSQGRNFGNDGSDYYQYIKQEMQFAIEQAEQRLNALQMAYDALDGAEGGSGDQNGFSGSGDRETSFNGGGNNGRQNFADSNDPTDGRTQAGRINHDAEGISNQELNSYLREGARNENDGSYDLRTKEGRALKAAGWVDDDGFPIQGRGRMFINNQMAGNR